ncbi:hypothetical protein GBA65_11875 [Rubrobacter marinus]|uniref:YoaR-like putative peptidoglycan binding domain-containing protein n=1 Tax=Rubrobacter marinus TaxID=2653852 RepID=A0A6G8PY25_9ACTN|nr:hypothetical protein GBA65_11875 [Rubrobacter marinus]
MLRSRTGDGARRPESARPGGFSRSGPAGGGKPRRRISVPIIVACALVAVVVAFDYWSNSGKIYRGVEVGPAEVGGETLSGAREIVEAEAAGPLEEIRLAGPEDVSFTKDELGISLDTEATLEEAYAVGREGNILQRLGDRLGAAWGLASVRPEILYDPEVARAKITELAGRLDKAPTEATVTVADGAVEVGPSADGYETDVEGTLANLDRAVGELTGETEVAGRALPPDVVTAEAEEAAARAEEVVSGPVELVAGRRTGRSRPRGRAGAERRPEGRGTGGRARQGEAADPARRADRGAQRRAARGQLRPRGGRGDGDGEPDGEGRAGGRVLRGPRGRALRGQARVRDTGRHRRARAHDRRGRGAQAHGPARLLPDRLHPEQRQEPRARREPQDSVQRD